MADDSGELTPERFFDAYRKLIYRIGRKAGLSVEEAQDVVQETILSVCRRIESFKADPAHGSLKSKVLQIARWKIADQIRKRRPPFEP